jgi:hypothetical protein
MPVIPRATEALRAETRGRLREMRAQHGTRVFLYLVADAITCDLPDLSDRATADRISEEMLRLAEGLET